MYSNDRHKSGSMVIRMAKLQVTSIAKDAEIRESDISLSVQSKCLLQAHDDAQIHRFVARHDPFIRVHDKTGGRDVPAVYRVAKDRKPSSTNSTISTSMTSMTTIVYELDMEGEPKCWLATVRFQSRGLWYEYVAALSWAAKAFGGEADAITFGEHMLGAAIMLCGMVMTALLIGEIANVLTNFDPALNAYRTSMDNLNQYITERNITTSLKRHLKEYYINSEGLFARPTIGRCCSH